MAFGVSCSSPYPDRPDPADITTPLDVPYTFPLQRATFNYRPSQPNLYCSLYHINVTNLLYFDIIYMIFSALRFSDKSSYFRLFGHPLRSTSPYTSVIYATAGFERIDDIVKRPYDLSEYAISSSSDARTDHISTIISCISKIDSHSADLGNNFRRNSRGDTRIFLTLLTQSQSFWR